MTLLTIILGTHPLSPIWLSHVSLVVFSSSSFGLITIPMSGTSALKWKERKKVIINSQIRYHDDLIPPPRLHLACNSILLLSIFASTIFWIKIASLNRIKMSSNTYVVGAFYCFFFPTKCRGSFWAGGDAIDKVLFSSIMSWTL